MSTKTRRVFASLIATGPTDELAQHVEFLAAEVCSPVRPRDLAAEVAHLSTASGVAVVFLDGGNLLLVGVSA